MQGLGNDFVLLDLRKQDFHVDASKAAQLADRHLGIGCDQVLVLRETSSDQQLASFEHGSTAGAAAPMKIPHLQ